MKTQTEALKRYLDDCDKHAIVPDIAGAFHFAWQEALAQPEQEPLEYWNAVEGWVKLDEVREHFDSVGCGTIYKTAGEGREPLYTTPPQRKRLSGFGKAAIGRKHFGNPIPQEWYAAADDLEAAHGIKE